MPYLSASAVVIHYEEALYQVYMHLYGWYSRLGSGVSFSNYFWYQLIAVVMEMGHNILIVL